MSTVDPLEAALGGDPTPEPPAAGTPDGAAPDQQLDHPVLNRFGGDIAKALDAYQNLDREYGQQGQRLGQEIQALRGELDQLRQQGTPEPPHNSGGMALPDMSMDQLTQWFEEDAAQATAYLIAQGQQMTLEMINQTLDQRLAPVESQVGRSTATALVEGLGKKLGQDVVTRNADVVASLLRDDPDLFKGDPTVVFRRMEDAVLAADARAQRGASNGAATPAGTPPADVSVMGGSQGRNPSDGGDDLTPAEEFRAALIAAQGEKRDVFGNPVQTR